ncbi:glycosyltransferase family 2 protein [Marinomonas shanghaiensis]|uniref:glycosyltransferase family 2 protein n=1 Tax=Marinomonas shanghaiensis TaxID=2202418 RepID=UPI000DBA3A9A|nr:glycosyltransferase family 2 protein [Marinomonas shanghaiensis]
MSSDLLEEDKMGDIFVLNPNHSTTRRLIKNDFNQRAELINQLKKTDDKFETALFLSEGHARQGEGGLRKNGCVKDGCYDLPLITVITIVFNGEKHLEETILSVINQSYDNVEYIIIDGGSTDGTLDIIRKYEYAIDYWVSEKDNGISDAFNKGVRASFGDYIAILNADDFYFNDDVLEKLSLKLDLKENEIVYGKTKKLTADGFVLDKKDNNISWAMSVPFSHCSSFLSRNIYKEIGLYSEKYSIAMDVDLLIRAKSVAKIKKIPDIIAVQRDGGVSDRHRFRGYREYIRASYPFHGFKVYFFYYLKIAIALNSKFVKPKLRLLKSKLGFK